MLGRCQSAHTREHRRQEDRAEREVAQRSHGDAWALHAAVRAAVPEVHPLQQVAAGPCRRLLDPNPHADPVEDRHAHERVVVARKMDANAVRAGILPLRAALGPVALRDPRLVDVELMPARDEYPCLEEVKHVDL